MSEHPLRRAAGKLLPHPHDASEACPGGCEDILEMEDAVCKSRAEVKELDARVSKSQARVEHIEIRIDESYTRLVRVETLLATTTAKLDTNSAETSEILSLMREGEAFFRFSKKIGEVLKWGLGIATAVMLFWAALKDWRL